MQDKDADKAWVSFCMSTYKRPALLKNALEIIAKQNYQNFEVVISDNDPEGSAGPVVQGFNDKRFRYFSNGENLGMIPSYNKSIERAATDYIVMITDDDPVTDNFLEELFQLYTKHAGYSIYGGFLRKSRKPEEIEIIKNDSFIEEVLDMRKTPFILWSSCVMKKEDVIQAGKLADYGGAHLADHALIAMVGSMHGAVIINKMYSVLSGHDNNFSKSNVMYYATACRGFYELMIRFCSGHTNFEAEKKVITQHIGKWFITCMFNLKKYYTLKRNEEILAQVNICSAEIISFPFMQPFKARYFAKQFIFNIKKVLHLLQ
jgi:glycosyltransferase involved in cell wall biosynthesis